MQTTGLTPAQASMLDWALALFDAAGLHLPPLEVVAHDTTEACWGRTGAHVRAGGHSIVHVCTRETGQPEELLYVHELAHARDAGELTDDRRSAFLALRGLTEWRNDDPERWYARGAEQAAEMILWGLMDRPVWIVTISGVTCGDLLAGYVTLVGRPPPHGYTAYCDP